jgi:formyl-CoA transferase
MVSDRQAADNRSGPLKGVRVLEFTQIIAGPLGCQLLSDLGAEVIKVEPPAGEPWRIYAQYVPLESKVFHALNRGKQSLAIDMAAPEAQEAIHRLMPSIDVVVINYRPDVARRLGIDYETLSALRPDLIYMDNTAFGRHGEMANRPGYDIVVQAMTGLNAAVGKVDERGNPIAPPAVADTTTGYAIAAGVSAALFHRAMTGEGQRVETSLLANALTIHMSAFSAIPAADAEEREAFAAMLDNARETGVPYADFLKQRDALIRNRHNFYYRCFVTSDGAIAVGALSASLRAKVRAVLGVDHNRDEPGYNPHDPEQQRIDEEVMMTVEAMIRAETCEHWERAFEAGGVPVSRINFVQELVDHPQVLANDYVVELEHDLTGPQRLAAPPWTMSKTPPRAQGASPPLGRDTEEILASLGYSIEEVEKLRACGVIR